MRRLSGKTTRLRSPSASTPRSRPCEEAILELELPKGGTVAVTRVEVRSAYTALAEGGADFLNEGANGWKISAAGCREVTPEHPYECELEG